MKRLRDIVLGAAAALAISLAPSCATVQQYSTKPWGDNNRYRCEITFSADGKSDAIVLYDGWEILAARDHEVGDDGEHHWMYRFYREGKNIANLREVLWNIRAEDAQEYLEFMKESQDRYKMMMDCERRLQEEVE